MWKIVQVWIFLRIALNLGYLIAASVDCATIITTIVQVTYVVTKTLLLLWPGSLFNIRDGFLSLLVMLIVMLFSFFYYVAAFRRILDLSCFVYCLTLCDTSWGSYSSPTCVLSYPHHCFNIFCPKRVLWICQSVRPNTTFHTVSCRCTLVMHLLMILL